jgi:hypothetical protein
MEQPKAWSGFDLPLDRLERAGEPFGVEEGSHGGRRVVAERW